MRLPVYCWYQVPTEDVVVVRGCNVQIVSAVGLGRRVFHLCKDTAQILKAT